MSEPSVSQEEIKKVSDEFSNVMSQFFEHVSVDHAFGEHDTRSVLVNLLLYHAAFNFVHALAGDLTRETLPLAKKHFKFVHELLDLKLGWIENYIETQNSGRLH